MGYNKISKKILRNRCGMSYFLILSRSHRDIVYKDDYLIHLSGIKQIEKFLKSFCKRNRIKIKGDIDISKAIENYVGYQKRLTKKRKV